MKSGEKSGYVADGKKELNCCAHSGLCGDPLVSQSERKRGTYTVWR